MASRRNFSTFCYSGGEKEKVTAPDPWGHPSQVPYVMVWQDLVKDPPEWFKPFVHKLPDSPNVQALVMKTPTAPEEAKKNKGPKPVLQESSDRNLIDLETEIRPPPYAPPPLQVPLGGRAPPMNQKGQGNPDPGERIEEIGVSRIMENLHLLYRHSPSGWDQLTQTESEPINTGPFPILFTHNPTWDDCQQLLQVLFNTEERERILAEAQKRVPGVDGRPTAQPHLVDEGFPLLRPNWDFERVEGSGDTGGFRLEDAVEGTTVKQRWDRVTTTTRRPGATRAPAKPAGPPAEDDFNLADALDDQNDRDYDRKKPSVGGGGFSDKDLEDLVGGGDYKPDKGKGGGQYGGGDNSDSGMSAETGTIAGVASALAMALIGAVSSYISYQQKKFCFSIQQGLNADYVKGENLEAVVCEEPQVKYSALQTQSAEPPPPEPPRI